MKSALFLFGILLATKKRKFGFYNNNSNMQKTLNGKGGQRNKT